MKCDFTAVRLAFLFRTRRIPGITAEDFSLDQDTAQIVLCDRPENHELRYANGLRFKKGGQVQIEANLLLTNGNVVVWYGNLSDYKTWFDRFVEGAYTSFPPGVSNDELRRRPASPAELETHGDN